MDTIKKHFEHSIFPASLIQKVPPIRKLKSYGSRIQYEVKVNPEKMDMKFIIADYNEEDIDLRISYSPVTFGKGESLETPSPKWYIYEKSSMSIGFAATDMEYCICGFLYLLNQFGHKHTSRKIRQTRRR